MRLTPLYYAQAWYQALHEVPKAQWSDVSRRVLQHIYQHGHVKWLPDITRHVARLQHEQAGTTAVTVRSAHALEADFVESIVKRYLPTVTPIITQEVDDRLIGGVQIETANLRYNTSVKSQLNQLAHYVRN